MLGQWRHAAATDAEDFGIVEVLLDSAQRLAALVLDGDAEDQDDAVTVSGFVSDLDAAHVVEIDTTETTGRVRVFINDGTVYDGDPETDAPPGAVIAGCLGCGPDTSTFRATSEADATAQYLDVVASNLLVWSDPDVEPGGVGVQR